MNLREDKYVVSQSGKIQVAGKGSDVRLDMRLSFNTKQSNVGASITGNIVDSSNAPIKGAVVKLMDAKLESLSNAMTDANGNYSMTLIPFSNLYNIIATAPGKLLSKPVQFTLESGQTTAINFTLQTDTTNTLGAISGSVLDINANAIVGSIVLLYTMINGTNTLISITYTDTLGIFVFSELDIGDYSIKITALGYLQGQVTTTVQNGMITTLSQVLNTNPNAPNGIVSGVITDSSGNAVANGAIILYKVNSDNDLTPIAFSKTNTSGIYTFINVPPGNYLIKSNESQLVTLNTSTLPTTPDTIIPIATLPTITVPINTIPNNITSTTTIVPETIYNAALGVLTGGATIDSNTGYVGFIGGPTDGSSTVTINVSSSENYNIAISCIAADTKRTMKVDVNGINTGIIYTLPQTLDWSVSNALTYTIPVVLNAGNNIIKFYGNGTEYAPSLGLFTVTSELLVTSELSTTTTLSTTPQLSTNQFNMLGLYNATVNTVGFDTVNKKLIVIATGSVANIYLPSNMYFGLSLYDNNNNLKASSFILGQNTGKTFATVLNGVHFDYGYYLKVYHAEPWRMLLLGTVQGAPTNLATNGFGNVDFSTINLYIQPTGLQYATVPSLSSYLLTETNSITFNAVTNANTSIGIFSQLSNTFQANIGNNGGYVVVTVTVPTTGTYNLAIQYLAGDTDRLLQVDVNGSNSGSPYIAYQTVDWVATNAKVMNGIINLNTGANTIKLYNTSNALGPWVGNLTIKNTTQSTYVNITNATNGNILNGANLQIAGLFVGGIGEAGGCVICTVTVPTTGAYNLGVQYLNNNIVSQFKVDINGIVSNTVYNTMPTPAYISSAAPILSIPVVLNAGANKIKFYNNSNTIAPWIGNLIVTSTIAMATTLPVITYNTALGILTSDISIDSNTGYVSFIGGLTDGASTIIVSVSSAGVYNILIKYITADTNRAMKVDVNGINTRLIYLLPKTSDWTVANALTYTIALNLNAGNNMIKFHGDGTNYAPNLGLFTVMPKLSLNQFNITGLYNSIVNIVQFDTVNKKLVVTSTGSVAHQYLQNNIYFGLSLYDNNNNLKASSFILGQNTGNTFAAMLNGVSFDYGYYLKVYHAEPWRMLLLGTVQGAPTNLAINGFGNVDFNTINLYIQPTGLQYTTVPSLSSYVPTATTSITLNAVTNANTSVGVFSQLSNTFQANIGNTGGYVVLTVTVPTAGIYNLAIQYLAGDTDRSLQVDVNGSNSGNLFIAYQTATWTITNAKVMGGLINLNAGANTIKLYNLANASSPWVGNLTIASVKAVNYINVTNVTTGSIINGANLQIAGLFVGGIGDVGGYVVCTVTVPIAGAYNLGVQYLNNNTSVPFKMDINGVISNSSYTTVATSYYIPSVAPVINIPVTLNAGANTVKFYNNSNTPGPLIGNLIITSAMNMPLSLNKFNMAGLYNSTVNMIQFDVINKKLIVISTGSIANIYLPSNMYFGVSLYDNNNNLKASSFILGQNTGNTFASVLNGVPFDYGYYLKVYHAEPWRMLLLGTVQGAPPNLAINGFGNVDFSTVKLYIKQSGLQYVTVPSINSYVPTATTSITLNAVTNVTTATGISPQLNNTFQGAIGYSGGYVILTVTVPTSGVYNLAIQYLSGDTDRLLQIDVNESNSGNPFIAYQTADWVATNAKVISGIINLNAGANTIKLYNLDNAPSPWIGNLTITSVTAVSYINITNATTGNIGNGASLQVAGLFVGGIGDAGGYVISTVVVPTTGIYNLGVQYLNNNSISPFKMDINGVVNNTVYNTTSTPYYIAPVAPVLNIPVTLNAGTNTIKFYNNPNAIGPWIGNLIITNTIPFKGNQVNMVGLNWTTIDTIQFNISNKQLVVRNPSTQQIHSDLPNSIFFIFSLYDSNNNLKASVSALGQNQGNTFASLLNGLPFDYGYYFKVYIYDAFRFLVLGNIVNAPAGLPSQFATNLDLNTLNFYLLQDGIHYVVAPRLSAYQSTGTVVTTISTVTNIGISTGVSIQLNNIFQGAIGVKGAYLMVTTTVPTTGVYNLAIQYLAGDTDRLLQVDINGSNTAKPYIASKTSDWTISSAKTINDNIVLTAGVNTIKLYNTPNTLAPWVGNLTISTTSYTSILPSKTYNVALGILSNGGTIDINTAYAMKLGGIIDGASTVTVSISTKGTYTIIINYLSGDGVRNLKVDINGVNTGKIYIVPQTIDWSILNSLTYTIPVTLNSGNNTIKFHGDGVNNAPYIGLFTIN